MTEARACLLFTPLSVDRDGGQGASSQLPPSPDSGETTHVQSVKLTELCARQPAALWGTKTYCLTLQGPAVRGGF